MFKVNDNNICPEDLEKTRKSIRRVIAKLETQLKLTSCWKLFTTDLATDIMNMAKTLNFNEDTVKTVGVMLQNQQRLFSALNNRHLKKKD